MSALSKELQALCLLERALEVPPGLSRGRNMEELEMGQEKVQEVDGDERC